MNNVTTIGIDLAKNIFQICGVNKQGKLMFNKRMGRKKMRVFIAQQPPCLIGMEACGSAHYWARKFRSIGHTVKLMSPQYVKPYVKGHKNDSRDAEACCEAVGRPSMRFVSIKAVSQQDMQCLHRVRSLAVQQRTALMNQARGLASEYGVTIPQGLASLKND